MNEYKHTALHQLIKAGESILTALSGGADSLALFDYLEKNRQALGIRLGAAHIDHGLRPSSRAEYEAVETLCRSRGIPFYGLHADAAARAKQDGVSTEEAGRRIRYEFFQKISTEEGYDKLATAHHRDDQAETVLLRLARGTGPMGAAGIQPIAEHSGLTVIRPLLYTSKADIYAYCQRHALSYIEDESNADTTYDRNYVRHNILPALTRLNTEAPAHIAAFAQRAAQQNDFVENVLDGLAQTYLTQSDGMVVIDSSLFTENAPGVPTGSQAYVRAALLRRAAALLGKSTDIGAVHIDLAKSFYESHENGTIDLPHGLKAVKNNNFYAIIEYYKVKKKPFGVYPIYMGDIKQVYYFAEEELKLKLTPVTCANPKAELKKLNKALLNYDIIADTLEFRSRRPGDRILLPGMEHSKKLARFFIDSKLPEILRDRTPVLASGSDILWIPGLALSQKAAARNGEAAILFELESCERRNHG